MEAVLFLVAFYGGIALITWVSSGVSKMLERRQEKIKVQVAEELLAGLDIKTEISSYRQKMSQILRLQTDEKFQRHPTPVQSWGVNTRSSSNCPVCAKGLLVVRSGKFGKFFGCTKYPDCRYTTQLEKVKAEYRKNINEQLADDMHRAYFKI